MDVPSAIPASPPIQELALAPPSAAPRLPAPCFHFSILCPIEHECGHLIAFLERVLKPRLDLLVSPAAERLLGFALLILAVILFLPIPLGNMLPAVAICIVSLALVEHDGLAVLVGILIGVIAVTIVWGALFGLVNAALALLSHLGWV